MSPVLWVVALGLLVLPAAACGPGGGVYVGVSAPGPWVGYPGGGRYPGYGYPGYRWEEEDGEQDALDAMEWQAPWAEPTTQPAATPLATSPEEDA